MNRPNYSKKIEDRILSMPYGTVFVTADFHDIADTQTVSKSLSRLCAGHKIRRLAWGIYDRPVFSTLLNEYAAADMNLTAKAIARNFGWTVFPCGDTALSILGISTQIPAVWQYVSDGPYREYQFGKTRVCFKHCANKDISGLSEKNAILIQALKALGKDSITEEVLKKFSLMLSREESISFAKETERRTVWIHRVAKEILLRGEYSDGTNSTASGE